jgi:hypothetical protein
MTREPIAKSSRAVTVALLVGLLSAFAASAFAQTAATPQPDVQSPARLPRPDPATAAAQDQQTGSTAPVGRIDQRTFATFPRTYSKAYGPNVIDRAANPGESQKGKAYNVKARDLPRGVSRP